MAFELPPPDFGGPPPMPPPVPPQEDAFLSGSRPSSISMSPEPISRQRSDPSNNSGSVGALWRNPGRPTDSGNLKNTAAAAGVSTLRKVMTSPRGNSGSYIGGLPAYSETDTIVRSKSPISPVGTLPRSFTESAPERPVPTLDRKKTGSQNSLQMLAAQDAIDQKKAQSSTISGGMDPIERRQKIVKEILSSEVSYVAQLDNLLSDLKLVKAGSMVSSKHVIRIFGNLETLHSLHSKQFLPELKNRLRTFSSSTLLGDLFLTILPFFKAIYTQYVSNYSNALEALRQLMGVSGFTDYIKNNWSGNGTIPFDMHLRSLLITPVQRIPRYELLLKDVVRVTDSSHPDFANLTQAQANMQAVAEWANELIELSGALRSETQRESIVLAKPGRAYLCEATFSQPRPKDKPPRLVSLHVFSDCILLARRKDGSPDQRSFDGLIYIKSLRIDVLSDECIVLNTDKDILSPVGASETKKWYLTASSASDCQGFVTLLAKLKEGIQKKETDGKARPKHKLHAAVKRCDLDATREILRTASVNDVNIQDHKGRTPLHTALKKKENAIVTALLNAELTLQNAVLTFLAGASTKIVANDGMSPYDMAVRTGYEDGLLQQLGWPRLGSPRGSPRGAKATTTVERTSPLRRAPEEKDSKDKHKSPIFGATLDKLFRREKSNTNHTPSPQTLSPSYSGSGSNIDRQLAAQQTAAEDPLAGVNNPLLGTAPVLWNPAARSPRTSGQVVSNPEYGDASRRLCLCQASIIEALRSHAWERVDARLADLMKELAELQTERAVLVKVLEKNQPRPVSAQFSADGSSLV